MDSDGRMPRAPRCPAARCRRVWIGATNGVYALQAAGFYKCCNTVYGAPTRRFAFDIDFYDLAKLPPLTPVFRDLNALGFSQEMRPGK